MSEQQAFELQGRVEAVLVACQFGSSASIRFPKIQVVSCHGVKGDTHAGTRLTDVREKALLGFGLLKGMPVANMREFSAVSAEDLAAIGKDMQLPEAIQFGSLGENIVVSGVPRLTELPTGTMLFFQKKDGAKRTAVLAVWGENMPCIAPGQVIQSNFPNTPDIATLFPEVAKGRRGVVGFVYCSGFIHEGDVVIIKVPAQKLYTPHTPA